MKKHMTKLGMLYGYNLFIDSDDREVVKHAEKYMKDCGEAISRQEISPWMAKLLGYKTKTYIDSTNFEIDNT